MTVTPSLRLRRFRLVTIALALSVSLSGCFAPSYLGVERPYHEDTDAIFKTYQASYDAFVAAQLYPLPLAAALDTGWGEPAHDVIMTIAMPIALVGMIVIGTIASPIVILLPEDSIPWRSFSR